MSTTYDKLPHVAQMIIAECVPERGKRHVSSDPDFWTDYNERKGALDIKFVVNGFELDFAEFSNELERQWDRATAEAGRELLKERALDLQDKLRRIETSVDDAIRAEFPELNE